MPANKEPSALSLMITHRFAHTAAVSGILLLLSLYFSNTLIAQDTFHIFTNKEGKEIEAQLVSITPDLKRANIKIKGRNEVPVEIITLSLDDQQYLKNWLKNNPVKMDFDLDFAFSKNVVDEKKVELANYNLKFISEETNFEIEIKNRTRAKLAGATLEYYIITEHEVSSYPNNNQQANVDVWFFPIEYYNRKREGDRDRKKNRKSYLFKTRKRTDGRHTFQFFY